MADDDDQDKSQEPTPRKRQEAREEGNVAKSQDLAAGVVLFGSLLMLWMLGGGVWMAVYDTTIRSFTDIARVGDVDAVRRLSMATLSEVGWTLVPMMAALVFFAIVANVAQVGLLLAPKKLQPKLETLDPIKGFKKLFFTSRTYVGFGMNLLKLFAVAAVAAWAVWAELGVVVGLQRADAVAVGPLAAASILKVGFKVAAALLIISMADFAYQRWKHEQDLKMTHQQVKDEMKKMEGDPQIKQRRRQVAMQRSMQSIRTDVPGADVIVTNPTHFAVAIKYDEGTMHAPRVVAKGGDLMAMRIREIATANGVPIVEKPPLARALFGAVDVGGEIPEDFYSAVAELLAYVYRLDRQLASAT